MFPMDTSQLFRKVRVARASEEVVKQVEEAVFSGRLSPGDRLPPERELAEKFGLSRMTIRDALRVLESTGLVKIKVGAGGGAFVREPNLDTFENSLSAMLRARKVSLLDLAEARNIIETATAELAAKRASKKDIEAMRAAVDEAAKALEEDNQQFMPHSVSFHGLLAKASKNHILELTVSSLRSLFSNALEQLSPSPEMAQRAVRDHRAILRAIEAGDGTKARQAMTAHLAFFEKKIREFQRASDAAQ
ncbi:MAG: FadR/GntR family transcriptional regulator [Acidobacteriota bacterium]